ncbi:glycoside hydrolase family 5 protein [Candidatus Bathyarchaeota archaeon]|nr:MAG: glycoside hydrolase family 5 protein [Candidatus Bathyarchaeota archaeon]
MTDAQPLNRRSLAFVLLVLSIAGPIFVPLNIPDSTGKAVTISHHLNLAPASTSGSVPVLIGWGGVGLGETLSDIQTEMQTLNQSGYNTVRVAFEPTCTIPPDGNILGRYDATKLSQVIGLAKQYGLWVIVDYHGYTELETSSSKQCWLGFWQSLVANFTSSYSQIIWEGLNEPHMTSNTDVAGLSSAYQALINEVRALGDTHWIVVQSMCSASCGFSDSNMAAGYPMVTDPLGNLSQGGRIFISLHSYMGYQWYSSSWNNATADFLAHEFLNAVVTGMKTTGWPALNTEGGTSTGSQVPPDEVLSGSSGYSVVSFHFAQTLTNLYDGNSPQRINWVWWTAGSWTNTPGAGTLGSLQCNSHPIGWGCLLAFTPVGPPAADFTIFASSPITANTGQSATSTITAASLYGFTGAVSLTERVPSGLTCGSISPGNRLDLGTGGSVSATISCNTTDTGNHTLTITGTSGSLVHSTTATFNFQGNASQPSGGGLCLSCLLPKGMTMYVWLVALGALIGLVSTIALLHVRARLQLAAARRRARSLNQ